MKYLEPTRREKEASLRELIIREEPTAQVTHMSKSTYNKWYYKLHKDAISERRKAIYLNKKNKIDKYK